MLKQWPSAAKTPTPWYRMHPTFMHFLFIQRYCIPRPRCEARGRQSVPRQSTVMGATHRHVTRSRWYLMLWYIMQYYIWFCYSMSIYVYIQYMIHAYHTRILCIAQERRHSKKPNRGTLKPCRSTIEPMQVMDGHLAMAMGKTQTWYFKHFGHVVSEGIRGVCHSWEDNMSLQHCHKRNNIVWQHICVFFTYLGRARSIQHHHSNTLDWSRGTKMIFLGEFQACFAQTQEMACLICANTRYHQNPCCIQKSMHPNTSYKHWITGRQGFPSPPSFQGLRMIGTIWLFNIAMVFITELNGGF